jgi:hypothetical protein
MQETAFEKAEFSIISFFGVFDFQFMSFSILTVTIEVRNRTNIERKEEK